MVVVPPVLAELVSEHQCTAEDVCALLQHTIACGREFSGFADSMATIVADSLLIDSEFTDCCQADIAQCYAGLSSLKQAPDAMHIDAITRIVVRIESQTISQSILSSDDEFIQRALVLAMRHVNIQIVADKVRVRLLGKRFCS